MSLFMDFIVIEQRQYSQNEAILKPKESVFLEELKKCNTNINV